MTSYSEAVAGLYSVASECTVASVRIGLEGSGDDRCILADYDLVIDAPTPARRLVFDFLNCPFQILGGECEDATIMGVTSQLLFTVNPKSEWKDGRTKLRLRLRWTDAEEGDSLPLPLFPRQLPKPAQRTARPGDYLRAPLFLAPGPIDAEVVGIQRESGAWNPQENEQIQIVLLTRATVGGRLGDVVLARYPIAVEPTEQDRAVVAEIDRERAFVERIFAVPLTARLATVSVTESHSTLKSRGPAIVSDEKFLAQVTSDPGGFSRGSVFDIAGLWWTEGIQIPGIGGPALALGICRWLTAKYLADEGRVAELNELENHDRRLAAIELEESTPLVHRQAKIMAQLSLRLSEADQEDPAVATGIAAMTRDFWGRSVEPIEVARRLRELGIETLEWPEEIPFATGTIKPIATAERWTWTVAYFAVGFALLVAVSKTLAGLTPTIGSITLAGGVMSGIPVWKRYRERIIRDLAWGSRIALYRIQRLVNTPAWFALHWKVPPVSLRGITVYTWGAPNERESRIARLAETIDCIRAVSPSRYARLVRLGRPIYIGWIPGAGAFIHGVRVIALNETTVDMVAPEVLAAVLCHELVHAHCDALGMRMTPRSDTRQEILADLEMRIWLRRLIITNRPQNIDELRQLISRNRRMRKWWVEDGTRIDGATFDDAAV